MLAGVTPASALVAIRPSSGDVLAAASGPGGGGLSTATVGQYAPGSTFKVVTSLALLRSGLEPSSTMFCPETVVVDGKRFKNYDDYPADGTGRIPLSLAVANSCNTAFIGERETVDQPELAQAAAALGLGVDHDLGFPAYFGQVPATHEEAGSETGHAASLIGQGRVTASPLAMAAVAASVAKGSVVVPRLLPDQPSDAADPAGPADRGRGPAAPHADARRGHPGQRPVPGERARRPGAGQDRHGRVRLEEPLQTHAWMIAVHGDLAVAVFVDEATRGPAPPGRCSTGSCARPAEARGGGGPCREPCGGAGWPRQEEAAMLRFQRAGRSHTGLVRAVNEDSGFAGPSLVLVADGVGGAAAGEVASATAAYVTSALALGRRRGPGHRAHRRGPAHPRAAAGR